MIRTYTEKYKFEGVGKGYVNAIDGNTFSVEFFAAFEFKDGLYLKLGRDVPTISEARSNLEGFLKGICQIKGNSSSTEYDLGYYTLNTIINENIAHGDDWLHLFCIEPNPRPTEKELTKGLNK